MLAVDLGDVRLRDIEWKYLRHGCHQKVIIVHEFAHAVKKLCALALGTADLGTGQLHAFFNVPDNSVLHLFASGFQQLSISEIEIPGAHDLENLVRIAQVRISLHDRAPQFFEHRAMRFEYAGDFSVDRQSAEITTPRYADVLAVPFQRLRKQRCRLFDGDGRTRVGPGDSRHHQRDIANGAPHRPLYCQRKPR